MSDNLKQAEVPITIINTTDVGQTWTDPCERYFEY